MPVHRSENPPPPAATDPSPTDNSPSFLLAPRRYAPACRALRAVRRDFRAAIRRWRYAANDAPRCHIVMPLVVAAAHCCRASAAARRRHFSTLGIPAAFFVACPPCYGAQRVSIMREDAQRRTLCVGSSHASLMTTRQHCLLSSSIFIRPRHPSTRLIIAV